MRLHRTIDLALEGPAIVLAVGTGNAVTELLDYGDSGAATAVEAW